MKIHHAVLFLTICMFFSCKKNQLNGDASISGHVAHHSKVIPGAGVFIKFKAMEFPGTDTTLYDAKVRADDRGAYRFTCYKGDYYLYAFGYDYDIPPPYEVSGGIPVKVRKNEDVQADLAVTEGD
ncbi:MAG TPA: hypothetical protein PLQ93_09600 [Bacteroidia bacterium]|nr:hypothetical protein [Bacteroidia bacterium]